jgi:hypothetical protein
MSTLDLHFFKVIDVLIQINVMHLDHMAFQFIISRTVRALKKLFAAYTTHMLVLLLMFIVYTSEVLVESLGILK